MIDVRVKQSDIRKITEQIRKKGKDFNDKAEKVLFKGAINIESRAKRNITDNKAVDTGRLRSSIQAKLNKGQASAEVATNVEYAPYVEFGTGQYVFANVANSYSFNADDRTYAMEFYKNGKGRMFARPYLFPALEVEAPKILNELKKIDI